MEKSKCTFLCNRIIPYKLTVAQLVKKFLAVYITRIIIAVSIGSMDPIANQIISIYALKHYFVKINLNVILVLMPKSPTETVHASLTSDGTEYAVLKRLAGSSIYQE
jgi:hypothetical protein